ncbi:MULTISPECIES: hypothetical protein [Paenibacillus]|uniref:Uncharacterized protein n=1 Tax=Paenibacillus odorifer TaxID=189426 RepID=A0ABX3HXH7_9BACL|nr:hypothetical protein [Paenibacillus odorifer]OMD54686.1 hypothetical protein BSK51_06375 [Paenibacillus odorifer]
MTFGISQYYGGPAVKTHQEKRMDGKYYTVYETINDPTTGNPIINFENYDRVVLSSEAQAPIIEIKDIPEAIRVTIYAPNEREFYVMNVDYIKGTY